MCVRSHVIALALSLGVLGKPCQLLTSKVNRFLLVKTDLFCVSGSGVIRYLGGEVKSCLRNIVCVRSSWRGRYFEVGLRLT